MAIMSVVDHGATGVRELNLRPPTVREGPERTAQPLALVTEEMVRTAARNGSPLVVQKNAVITPLARDTINDLGVEVIVRPL